MNKYSALIKQADGNWWQSAWDYVKNDPNMARNLGAGGIMALLAALPGGKRSMLNRILSGLGGFALGYGGGLGYDAWKNSQSKEQPMPAEAPVSAAPAAAEQNAQPPAQPQVAPANNGTARNAAKATATTALTGGGAVYGGIKGYKAGDFADTQAAFRNGPRPAASAAAPSRQAITQGATGGAALPPGPSAPARVVPVARGGAPAATKAIPGTALPATATAGKLSRPMPAAEPGAIPLGAIKRPIRNRVINTAKGAATYGGLGLITSMLANAGIDYAFDKFAPTSRGSATGGYSGK